MIFEIFLGIVVLVLDGVLMLLAHLLSGKAVVERDAEAGTPD